MDFDRAAKSSSTAMDELVGEKLDKALRQGTSGVMSWMREYVKTVDEHGHKDLRAGTILPKLLSKGYSADDADRQDTMSRDAYGRRIIGTMINMLAQNRFLPKPRVFGAWYGKYEEKPGPRDTQPIPIPPV